MNVTEIRKDLATAIIDALALVDAGIADNIPGEWAQYAHEAITRTVEFVLEGVRLDALSENLLKLQDDRLNYIVRERDHWKANHDAQVERARVLFERPDLPGERIRAYEQMERMQADLAAIRFALRVDDEPRETLQARTLEAIETRFTRGYAAALCVGADKPDCKCSMRTRLVGDGCAVCNPEYAAQMRGE